jgi:hypothetical protein
MLTFARSEIYKGLFFSLKLAARQWTYQQLQPLWWQPDNWYLSHRYFLRNKVTERYTILVMSKIDFGVWWTGFPTITAHCCTLLLWPPWWTILVRGANNMVTSLLGHRATTERSVATLAPIYRNCSQRGDPKMPRETGRLAVSMVEAQDAQCPGSHLRFV